MIIPLLDIFKPNKETGSKGAQNLTEEVIYSYCHYFLNDDYDRIPVFSASTANNGIIGFLPDLRKLSENQNHKSGSKINAFGINYYKNKPEGCITIVADGVYAGFSFYRPNEDYSIFCANISCMILFKKDDDEIKKSYPDFDGLNIEWFYLKFHMMLQNVVRGYGVKHFTNIICESIDELDIPLIQEQENELGELRKLSSIQKNVAQIEKNIEKTLLKEVNGFKVKINDEFSKIFDIEKGTGSFTEEAIYHAFPTGNGDPIPFFGGEKSHNKPQKHVGGGAVNKKNKPVKYFKGSCLILSMDGSAGYMTYKSDGDEFTLNHHAAIITVKDKYKGDMNLIWFKYEYQNTLIDSAVSKGSSRTLSLEVLNSIIITAPDITVQEDWVDEIEKLETIRDKFVEIKEDIIKLNRKELATTLV